MANKLSFSIALSLLTENFKKGTNQVQSMFAKLKGSVLGFAAVMGVGGASLRSFINTTADFEASVSKLSAILGKTPGQIKELTDNAKKLGETTRYTAAEATNLQTELAKLGFTKNEILSATESVLKFAQATDAGLADAATLAGAALRMFGAEASESKRYVSAMSIATTKSALSFAYLRDALPTVGPVAKAFNFTIEDTLALLGKLSDSGFDASSAATATRNILLNLADSNGKLAKSLGGSVDTLPDLISGLQKLRDKGVDLNTTLQLTDKRSVAAFNAFLQSADKIVPLREAITGVEGDLDQMAATMENNIKGATAGLASAWEAIMIKLSESTNGPLKSIIEAFTSLLRGLKSGFSGVVAFVVTIITGKLLQAIIKFFAKGNAILNTSVTNHKLAEAQKIAATQKRIAAQEAYLKVFSDYEKIQDGKRLASKKQLSKALSAIGAAEVVERKAYQDAIAAREKAAAVQSMTMWQRTNAILVSGWQKVATTLKALWSTLWPIALITAIGALTGKLVNMYKEAKRIKNIFTDYKKALEAAGTTQEISRMQTLLNIMNDRTNSQHTINAAQSELQKMLGLENQSQEDLNKLVSKRIELLKEAAIAEHAFSTVGEYTERNSKLALDAGLRPEQMERLAKLYKGRKTSKENYHYYLQAQREEKANAGNKELNWYKIEDVLPEFYKNLEVINDATSRAGEQLKKTASGVDIASSTSPSTSPSSEELERQQEQYAQSLRELNARRQVEMLTVDEYNKAYADLNKEALIKAMSSNDTSVTNSDFVDKLATEYSEAMQKIVASTSSEIMDSIQKEIEEEDFKVELTPIIGKRDSTFDYKASESDKISDNLNIWKKYRDDLQSAVNDGAEYLTTQLNSAIANVDSLESALKIAEVKEDIESFSKDLNESVYSGVKDIANSSDRMVNAFQNIRDVFSDVDASGWERIMAVWNAMTNTVDGLLSIIKTIETITELTDKLAKAKETEAAIDTATTGTKVANKVTETTAELTALSTQTTAEVALSTLKSTAASKEMAAKSAAAYAYIPFVGVGLAAAQIAAMEGLIAAASIPKFANGGIVSGGATSGDKILARVNAGEMILNGRQQSNLFNAINSGKMSGNNHVTVGFEGFSVRGDRLELAINNSRKSKGKKPL